MAVAVSPLLGTFDFNGIREDLNLFAGYQSPPRFGGECFAQNEDSGRALSHGPEDHGGSRPSLPCAPHAPGGLPPPPDPLFSLFPRPEPTPQTVLDRALEAGEAFHVGGCSVETLGNSLRCAPVHVS